MTAYMPGIDRHYLTCARCGAKDQTVERTRLRDGRFWDPTCALCSSRVERTTKAERMA